MSDAERELISKAVGSINLAAAYLDRVASDSLHDPARAHCHRLWIAAGALERLAALKAVGAAPSKEKDSEPCGECGGERSVPVPCPDKKKKTLCAVLHREPCPKCCAPKDSEKAE